MHLVCQRRELFRQPRKRDRCASCLGSTEPGVNTFGNNRRAGAMKKRHVIRKQSKRWIKKRTRHPAQLIGVATIPSAADETRPL